MNRALWPSLALTLIFLVAAPQAQALNCTCGTTLYACALTSEACDPGGLEVQAGNAAPKCDWKCNSTGQCPDFQADCPTTACDQNGDGKCVVCGTDGANFIRTTNGDDIICGKAGADTIYPRNGNDRVDAGNGDDTVDASGYAGEKYFVGGAGDDTLKAGDSPGGENDTLLGGSGNDCLFGSGGSDFLDGGPNDDFIVAGKTYAFSGWSYFLPVGPRMCGGKGNDTIISNTDGFHCDDAGTGQTGASLVPSCLPAVTISADCLLYQPNNSSSEVGATTWHCTASAFGEADCGCTE